MVKGKCLSPGCEFLIEDGQHIDDVCQRLREHWRAQHPTKFFSNHRHGERAASYNMEWDEILVAHFGVDWAAAGVDPENDRYFLNDISRSIHYSPEVLAHAGELLAAYNLRVQQAQNAPGPAVAGRRAPRFRPQRAEAAARADAFPMPQPGAFLPPLEFVGADVELPIDDEDDE